MSRTANTLTRISPSALRRALDPVSRRLLDAAVQATEATGTLLWAVGGPVRDLALGRPVRDLDLATATDPAPLAEAIAARLGATVHTEPRFGTASVVIDGHRLDLAATRTEHYVRVAALPSVRLSATIEADLARRDFTVNAVALAVTGSGRGQVIDPFGGLDDLAAGRLRILHSVSYHDDPTRLWRAGRLAARLRLLPTSETVTAQALAIAFRYFDAVSPRRLWREFALAAAEPRPGAAFALLHAWGVLAATHPSLALTSEASRALAYRRGPLDPALVLAVLLAQRPDEERAAAIARLGAPRSAARAAEDAARVLAAAPDPDSLDTLTAATTDARLAALWLDPARQRDLQSALRRWERTRPHLTPVVLRALGVPLGPALGRALAELRRERYLANVRSAATARNHIRARFVSEGTSR